MSIDVKHVMKSFGEQKAVNDISFSVKKGEVTGFLGPNGAGKSTTMKMITGYLLPDKGEIKVCDIPVSADPLEAKKKIGYLPESNPLYPDMYIREYLAFISGIHGIANAAKRMDEVMELTGLLPEAGKRIGQLSKGYKQRVGLAAALIHDPEVLILDEPTTGLDPNQIIEIRDVIRKLGENKTVLFSSHILQEVEALCHRVVIINQGRIVADGPLAELSSAGKRQRVHVTFRDKVTGTELEGLPGVDERESTDGLSWLLYSSDPDGLRKELLELSLRRNLNIVSLQSESGSLESLFRDLTKQSKT
jgi:ABC-2 type transport system ATP-binding protein